MKKPQVIVASAAALYFLALGVFWHVATRNAFDKTENLISRSERDFEASICGSVDTMLLHGCYEVLNDLEDSPGPIDDNRLLRYSELFMIDELNLVDTNGTITASTLPGVTGGTFIGHPDTEEFMKLFKEPDLRVISQPFRRGVHNPDAFRKYYGLVLPDGSAFLQVGMDFDRIAKSLYCLDRPQLLEWPFGRLGHFDFYDNDGDGVCDYDPGNPADGEIRQVVYEGADVYIRPFSYCAHHYIAVLPACEYFDGRDSDFQIFSLSFAAVLVFLAYFLISMSRAADRESKHRAREDAVRARDLKMSKSIQLSVLPNPDRYRKTVFTASFAAATKPAREVGGDFYDFYFIDSSHLAIIVADVSGKGISAAMFMMQAKNELYNALCSEHELVTAVTVANTKICENNDAEMFVTVWVGVLDVHSGELEYINAGHNRPFLRRADGTIEKIMAQGGLILGMFPKAKYKSSHLAFKPGEFLFLFSDGITEAMDRNQRSYGEERLRRELARCNEVPEDIIAKIEGSVRIFADGADQSDDLTSLALVWHGTPKQHAETFVAAEDSLGAAMDWLGEVIALSGKMAKSRILNAADEMMTNIVNYSGAKEFTMIVENSLARTRLTFVDYGHEYNPLSHVDPDTHVPLQNRPIGGLGILMTKRLVDAVHYYREDGRNVLTLVKLDD